MGVDAKEMWLSAKLVGAVSYWYFEVGGGENAGFLMPDWMSEIMGLGDGAGAGAGAMGAMGAMEGAAGSSGARAAGAAAGGAGAGRSDGVGAVDADADAGGEV